MSYKEPIRYINLALQWRDQRNDLLPIIEAVLESGQYVSGKEVRQFEQKAESLFSVDHVVGVSSGTDALSLSLAVLGIKEGDEVITPPNSFVASAGAIASLGAKPVFVDVGQDQNIDVSLIEDHVTSSTKAIMPVHLTGRMANMKAIVDIGSKYGIPVVEDAAQAVGSTFFERPSGTWGDIGCFSAHPLKNLNACGDAGFIVTNNKEIADRIRLMRNHGLIDRNITESFGSVSRMDEIQAAILTYRLDCLSDVINKRRKHVELYRSILSPDVVYQPEDAPGEFNSWHTYVIQIERRDDLQSYLRSKNIETAIHYPTPIHLQPASIDSGYQRGDFPMAERQANKILTLPIHQYLSESEICFVAETINEYLGG